MSTVATSLGISWQRAKNMLIYATTGQRPLWPRNKPATGKGWPEEKFRRIAPDVARMRDSLNMSWQAIIRSLKANGIPVAEATVRRAYDYAHSEEMKSSVANGEPPRRGSWRFLSRKKIREMQTLIRKGKLSVKEIAERVGVGQNTVRREREKMDRG